MRLISYFNFNGVEPFTLVRIGEQIEEIRWDGNTLFSTEKEIERPHIWSSVQLFSQNVIKARESWLKFLLNSKAWNAETMADFHHKGGIGDLENDLVMNRHDMVKTISISQAAWSKSANEIRHWNLEKN